MPRHELARFVRDRREGLCPADTGLVTDRRRRTPGLRREEVATLAHVSVDYYTRIEQARGPRPSPRVLDALADALQLTRAERAHLFRLAGTPPTPLASPVRQVRPYVTELLHRIPETAAVVTDATYTVVAQNQLAHALLGKGPDETLNLARWRFLGGGSGAYETVSSPVDFGQLVVARLRAAADRYPRDAELTRLLDELRAGSAEFTELWHTNPVHGPGHRAKTMVHPEVGQLRLNCDVLTVPEDDQQVVFVTADSGSTSARALRHLLVNG